MENNLNKLAKDIFSRNTKKGFYEEFDAIAEILKDKPNALKSFLHIVTAQRIALITSEASEALEADRKNKFCTINVHKKRVIDYAEDNAFGELFKLHVKDTVEDEIADVMIRCLDFCGANDIDIDFHIHAKLRFNALRPYKHGKIY